MADDSANKGPAEKPGAAASVPGGAAASASPSASNNASASASAASAGKPPPRGNPAFRALGLPNFRLRLPSRNWLIFWTIVGSWTGALVYDRREKKRIQKKWCDLVSHIADETLPQATMPRRMTIFLSSPPGDSIRVVREHFREYVKPVLVAAAMDWDVVEGRREGELRAGLAERIRALRRKDEKIAAEEEEDIVAALRQRSGIRDWDGVKGDVVIGRHTWKEYILGLHEGCLGPLEQPEAAATDASEETTTTPSQAANLTAAASPPILDTPEALPQSSEVEPGLATSAPEVDAASTTDAKPTETAPAEEEKKEEKKKPEKPAVTPAFITPADYASAPLARSIPQTFEPTTIIPFPYILGFLNTPIRMYRFLNRRKLADDVGRQTAAAVLGASRPFYTSPSPSSSEFYVDSPGNEVSEAERAPGTGSELQRLLLSEESEWPKFIRKPKDPNTKHIWTDPMVLDARVAERMRKFEVDAEEEARATRLKNGSEKPISLRKPGDVDFEGDEFGAR